MSSEEDRGSIRRLVAATSEFQKLYTEAIRGKETNTLTLIVRVDGGTIDTVNIRFDKKCLVR